MARNNGWKKTLQPYGDMMQQLTLQILADLKTKTQAELEEILDACDRTHERNSGRSIMRIKDTVRELVTYIKEED